MAFVESTMEALVTSDRTTGQTVLDSDGKVKNAPHNIWPTTDLSDGTAWTQTSLTSVTESGTSPSGKAAYSLLENTDSGLHRIRDGFTSVVGETYSFVMDIKANGRTDFRMSLPASQFGTSVQYTFDLSAVTTTQDTAGTNDSSAITLISDGWYRLVVTAEATLAASATTSFLIMDGASQSYAGDITKGVYLSRPRVYKSAIHGYSGTDPQGMQLATDDSDYVETTSGPVYQLGRAFDGNAACLGMQSFEGRTNLATYSNDFTNAAWFPTNATISVNSATSPDGTVNMSKLVEDAAGPTQFILASIVSVTSGTAYCMSYYAKQAGRTRAIIAPGGAGFPSSSNTVFNLDTGVVDVEDANVDASGIEDVGGGIYLIWSVVTADATISTPMNLYLDDASSGAASLTYTGDGSSGVHLYQNDIQAGAFRTPPIPTLSAAVARGADNASLLTSSFGYNASEGTVLATFSSLSGATAVATVLLTDTSNFMEVYPNSSDNVLFQTTTGGASQASIDTLANRVAGVNITVAAAYKANDFAASADGLTAVADTSGSVPPVTGIDLGSEAGAFHLNGYIKSLVYYPSRLIDASLERIST